MPHEPADQEMPTTPDEFLRWNEGREGKREFVRGKVVEMMINVTKRTTPFSRPTCCRPWRGSWTVSTSTLALRISECGRRTGFAIPMSSSTKSAASSGDQDLVARTAVLRGGNPVAVVLRTRFRRQARGLQGDRTRSGLLSDPLAGRTTRLALVAAADGGWGGPRRLPGRTKRSSWVPEVATTLAGRPL